MTSTFLRIFFFTLASIGSLSAPVMAAEIKWIYPQNLNQSLADDTDTALLKTMLEDIAIDAGVTVTITIESFANPDVKTLESSSSAASTRHLVATLEPRAKAWSFQGGYSLGFHKTSTEAQGSVSLTAERAYEACTIAKKFMSFLSGGKRVSTAPLVDSESLSQVARYHGINAFYW